MHKFKKRHPQQIQLGIADVLFNGVCDEDDLPRLRQKKQHSIQNLCMIVALGDRAPNNISLVRPVRKQFFKSDVVGGDPEYIGPGRFSLFRLVFDDGDEVLYLCEVAVEAVPAQLLSLVSQLT